MFRGVATAAITPFRNGKVDYEAFERFINFQIENGVKALVILGTSGEAATLSAKERDEVITFSKKVIDERVPMIIGTGSNNTAATIETSRRAEELGADGVLVVAPFYNKPNQEGLYRHFKTVAESIQIPVVVYNVPGRTGCNIGVQTILRLVSDVPNITAVKEASGDQYQCDSIIRAVRKIRPNFYVYSGNDDQAFHLVCGGGDGLISVLSNCAPKQTSQMIEYALEGELSKARDLHLHLLPLMKDLFLESNPMPIKYACSLLGYGQNELRLPLIPASETTSKIVRQDLIQLGILRA